MNQLRAIILSVWRNLSEASRAIGCNRQRLAGVVSGRLEMYAWEAAAVADAAGVDVLDVISAAQSVRRQRAGPNVKKSPRKYCSTSGSRQ